MLAKLPIPEIVLASSSPRRKLLLENIGLPHTVIFPTGEELLPQPGECASTSLANAKTKAESVIPFASDRAVLGVDTIVDLEGEPLGKPRDSSEAFQSLQRLSGRNHLVHTAVYFIEESRCLAYGAVETSSVYFRQLGYSEIEAYIATGEPLDKAGAYGIQERGAMLVERIEGCYFNVMGLPLARLWKILLLWMEQRGTPLIGW